MYSILMHSYKYFIVLQLDFIVKIFTNVSFETSSVGASL